MVGVVGATIRLVPRAPAASARASMLSHRRSQSDAGSGISQAARLALGGVIGRLVSSVGRDLHFGGWPLCEDSHSSHTVRAFLLSLFTPHAAGLALLSLAPISSTCIATLSRTALCSSGSDLHSAVAPVDSNTVKTWSRHHYGEAAIQACQTVFYSVTTRSFATIPLQHTGKYLDFLISSRSSSCTLTPPVTHPNHLHSPDGHPQQ